MNEYIIICPNHRAGMFSYIWETLKMIKANQNENIYIDWTQSIYQKKPGDNVWDYFFKQPFTEERPDKIKNIYYSNYVEQLNPDDIFYYVYNPNDPNYGNLPDEKKYSRRLQYNNLISKYCVLNSSIQSKIDDFYNNNFLNKKVLGVHMRGTDHPYRVSIKKSIEQIKKYADAYDLIYVSTDEFERYNQVKQTFGDKAITYNSLKSSSGSPLHGQFYPISETKYKTGEDVIIEAHLMSMSNFLLCLPHSNVNYYSIYRNINLPYATYCEALHG